MKKAVIAILIIVCLGILAYVGVNKLTSGSGTSNAKETTATNGSNINGNNGTSTDKKNAASKDAKKEDTGEKVNVQIGSASGAEESTVTIPISFKSAPAKGISSCNFNIKYDTGILEAVEVTPGELIGNNTASFDSSIIDTTGLVSFLFTSSNDGKNTITKDGVFANVKFKIKKGAAKGAVKVTQGTAGAFGDTSLTRVNAQFSEGKVTVN